MLWIGFACASLLCYLIDQKIVVNKQLRLALAEKDEEILALKATQAEMKALPPADASAPAPLRDDWVDKQFHLIELAWLGYPSAFSVLDGSLVNFIRLLVQRGGRSTDEVENWTRMKLLVGRLSADEADDGATVREMIDSWIKKTKEIMFDVFTTDERLALIHVLDIDDEDRMALFEWIETDLGNLLRLPRRDYTALSMNRTDFADYLRYIGCEEAQISEELAKYDAVVKPVTQPSPAQAVLQLQPATEAALSPALAQIATAITSVEATMTQLPEAAREPYAQRLDSLRKCQEKLMANAADAVAAKLITKIEAQLREAEILADTAVEVSEMS